MPENPKENDYNDMENPSDSAFEDATSIEDYPVEEKSMSSTLEEIRASEYEGQEQPQDSVPVEHIEPFDDVNRGNPEENDQTFTHEEPGMISAINDNSDPKEDKVEFVQTEFKPVIDETKLKAIEDESHRKGYEDGFMLGEEKGLLEADSKIQQIQEEFSKVIEEINSLKKSVLLGSQENFRTIAQAMVESILEKEFKTDPETFNSFIKKAIADTTTDDHFSVLVNQDTFNSLKNVNSDIEKHLKIDDSLEGRNFKIESKLGTVDGQIKKIISELLDKVDLNIIDNEAG